MSLYSIYQALHQLTNIHQQMGETLVQKYGVSFAFFYFLPARFFVTFEFEFFYIFLHPSGRCVTDDGSYSPSMDKPEQALDFVQDAVSSCGYSLGTDVHIALNCAASEIYDQVRI